ncbi:ribbon-helix-helix protein [Rhizobium rhizogenes]|jgi:hypothetical protein|uniref:ribbon-helix-helix protein n=1 Tax=Rhizobium rhizogenes TaxID=359 RepID=UPI001572B6B0|nr:hypothetical protein [Rhizobium rhizogenes]NTH17166.1 hypothetical protein [Rhizobium rhizogenes]NTH30139.1 hypothetical protein [Rhizobium rhizogenes]NTH43985.1 hypothetical protein [Rhizobium rhizogenes]NTH56850.1 hypothetical protein [Rhizobium rhizogenes]NTH88000.1 hypothetical protein [Rhizobium rhizogenes]
MTATTPKRGFVSRPGDPESWIRSAEPAAARAVDANAFTARLTIDVTPDQRARIKIAAFQRGVTVADMLRELLAREFPPSTGDAT